MFDKRKAMHLVYLCMIVCMIFSARNSFAQINWASDYAQALSLAKQTNKPVFLYFYSDKAKDCIKFNSETLNNAKAVNFLQNNFISLTINAQNNMDIVKKYGLFRAPTMIVLKPTGEEVSRFVTFYPPDKLINSLSGINLNEIIRIQPGGSSQAQNQSPGADQSQAPEMNSPGSGALFYESFDSLYGWLNEGSQPNCTVQLSLVQGAKGSAFRIEYGLRQDTFSYIQIHRGLSPKEKIKFPPEYTLIFSLAGAGGANTVEIKLADSDGTNFGLSQLIETDFKSRRYVFTSDKIQYLWGGKNKTLDDFNTFLIGISAKDEKIKSGVLFIDELMILPGIQGN